MQYARNLNRLSLHSINDDVWQRGDNEFTRPRHTSFAPHPRLLFQKLDLALDSLACFQRNDRVVLRDVVLDPVKIGMCAPGPFDTHALPGYVLRFADAVRLSSAARRLAQ